MRLVLATLAVLASACGAAAVPEPDAGVAQRSGTPLDHLRRGRQVYLLRCAGCHNVHPVQANSAAEWQGVVAKMAPVAKLSSEEAVLVASYLRAVTR